MLFASKIIRLNLHFACTFLVVFLGISGLTIQHAHAAGMYSVQLGSYSSQEEAEKQWNVLQKRFPALFSPLTNNTKAVQLPPENAVFYRNQAGPISSNQEADLICDSLLVEGFECYVDESQIFDANNAQATQGSAPQNLQIPTQHTVANIDVAEAIPVAPGTNVTLHQQPSRLATPASAPSPFSSNAVQNSQQYWAQLDYFDSQKSALNYWRMAINQTGVLGNNLRLRIITPIKQFPTQNNKLSLRVGPFTDLVKIRRLCAVARHDNISCRALKDMNMSVNNYAEAKPNRARALRAAVREQRQQQRVQPAAYSNTRYAPPKNDYWVHLGAYSNRQSAQYYGQRFKMRANGLLDQKGFQISTPTKRATTTRSYRLRNGPYHSQAEATSTCARLRQQSGILCIVVSE